MVLEVVTVFKTRGIRGPSMLFPSPGIPLGYTNALEVETLSTGRGLAGLIVASGLRERSAILKGFELVLTSILMSDSSRE
jgi:hypothetical protein